MPKFLDLSKLSSLFSKNKKTPQLSSSVPLPDDEPEERKKKREEPLTNEYEISDFWKRVIKELGLDFREFQVNWQASGLSFWEYFTSAFDEIKIAQAVAKITNKPFTPKVEEEILEINLSDEVLIGKSGKLYSYLPVGDVIIPKSVYDRLKELNKEKIVEESEEDKTEENIAIIKRILSDAISRKDVADIIIFPEGKVYRVKYTLVGKESEIQPWTFQFKKGQEIINALKTKANVEVAVSDKRQSGRITFEEFNLQLRAEFIPVSLLDRKAEMVGMRLIKIGQEFSKRLTDLNLPENEVKLLKRFSKLAKGLILVSGATASGKSTLIRSMIMEIDRTKRNIYTVENPVEEIIPHAIHFEEEEKLSFEEIAKGLMRISPNVIFFGEIRDKETAKYALEFAKTGHLVFTTIHANTAVDALSRLASLAKEAGKTDEEVYKDLASNLLLSINAMLLRIPKEDGYDIRQVLEILNPETLEIKRKIEQGALLDLTKYMIDRRELSVFKVYKMYKQGIIPYTLLEEHFPPSMIELAKKELEGKGES